MPNTLFMRLEGPLQAWGERGQWSVRDSAPEPTKSGIVGLLGCALGLNTDEALRQLSRQIRLAVRCDKPGTRLTDYHTVGGGYLEPQLLTAEGKPKITATSKEPHTEQTWRDYLADASFLVAIQSDLAMIERLAVALQNPRWTLYLGRKSCPPACPLYEGEAEYTDLYEALQQWPWWHFEVKQASELQVRAVVESDAGQGIRRRHELVSRKHRVWGPRYTQDVMLTIQVLPKEA